MQTQLEIFETLSKERQLEEYEKALHAFDWWYAWSDDRRVFKAGEEQFKRLQQWQKLVDPDLTLWRKYAV